MMAILAAMLALNPAQSDPSADADEATLYERLGGYDAIAAVVDELIAGVEDKFAGFSEHSLMRTRQLIVDFMCSATGGPCFYAGRDMRTTHAGLGITPAQWEEFVQVFSETMDAFEVPEREQEELAGLLLPLEEQIVDRQ
jgi:hemoglobin